MIEKMLRHGHHSSTGRRRFCRSGCCGGADDGGVMAW
jgi:hypothetical protein